MALFTGSDGEGEAEQSPGWSDIQAAAAQSRGDTLVIHQPMQSVALRPAAGVLTRPMQLLWLKLVQEVQKKPIADTYEIPLKDVAEFLEDRKHYDRLRANLRALNVTQVEWNDVKDGKENPDEVWGVTTLLSQAEIKRTSGGTGTIEIALPPKINKGVRVMKQFSALNLLVAREMKTPAALNLYRIAVAYETNPSRVTFRKPPVEWDSLLRGVPRQPEKDFVYKYFKRDVLLPAMAEVNRLTNITLELLEHRESGRTVLDVQFAITNKGEAPRPGAAGKMSDEDQTEVLGMLKSAGFSSVEARQMVASYGMDRVRRNLQYFQRATAQGTKIRTSQAAYLKAAIRADYADADRSIPSVTVVDGDARSHKETSADREVAMQQYLARRRTEAHNSFMEMIRRDSEKYWLAYQEKVSADKNQTLLAAIQSKGLKAKIVEVSFYDWLADKVFGPITEAGFIDFLVSHGPKSRGRKTPA
jgi:hypothetical protein